MKYVLIIILSISSTSQNRGVSTVQAEFQTFAACEAARLHIIKNIDESLLSSNKVVTHGCYLKGDGK